jgi:hypothetical protein
MGESSIQVNTKSLEQIKKFGTSIVKMSPYYSTATDVSDGIKVYNGVNGDKYILKIKYNSIILSQICSGPLKPRPIGFHAENIYISFDQSNPIDRLLDKVYFELHYDKNVLVLFDLETTCFIFYW